MKYLGIDLGSTSVKSAVFDLETGNFSDSFRRPSPKRIISSHSCIYELDAAEYFRLVKELIDKTAESYADLKGLVFSTQMHGFVLDDRYVSWQDFRCLLKSDKERTYLEELQLKLSRKRMENCGVYLKPSLGLCNLYAKLKMENRMEQEKELYTLGSYFIHKLTGKNICHISNAAPLGLVDLTEGRWDDGILKTVGISGLRLPQISEEDFASCGIYEICGREILIYPDYGDQQTAVLGSGANEKDGIVNVATAAQVIAFRSEYQPGLYEVRPYFGKRYINVISNLPSGRNLGVLIHLVKNIVWRMTGEQIETEEVYRRLAEGTQAEPQGLEMDMSFYPGSGTFSGGKIQGIKPENFTMDHIFTAAYENMAKVYWKNLCGLKENFERIVCIGGVCWKNEELVSMISKISGLRCCRPKSQDEVLLGLFEAAKRCSGNCETSGKL